MKSQGKTEKFTSPKGCYDYSKGFHSTIPNPEGVKKNAWQKLNLMRNIYSIRMRDNDTPSGLGYKWLDTCF